MRYLKSARELILTGVRIGRFAKLHRLRALRRSFVVRPSLHENSAERMSRTLLSQLEFRSFRAQRRLESCGHKKEKQNEDSG